MVQKKASLHSKNPWFVKKKKKKDAIIHSIQKSLPHSRAQWGIPPIVYHCQIQMAYPCFAVESLSDWVVVSPQSQAFTLPALEMAVRRGRGGRRWHCLPGIVWPFQPRRAQCAVSQPCGPGKVRRVRLDQCACPAACFPWSVLSVRGEVEQAGLRSLEAFLEEHNS